MMRHFRTESDLLVELPNDLASFEQAVDFVMRECPSCANDSKKIRLNFRVSLIEALSNAMLYGNGDDPRPRVAVLIAPARVARVRWRRYPRRRLQLRRAGIGGHGSARAARGRTVCFRG